MRATPRQDRSRETFRRILEAAAELIHERGSDALKLTDVAVKANVPIGSVYRYFPNKRAILAKLAREYFRQFNEDLSTSAVKATDLASLEQSMHRMIWRIFRRFQNEPVLRDVLSGCEADRDIEEINLADSRESGDRLYEKFIELGGEPSPMKRIECFMMCHLSGSAFRMALAVPPKDADLLVERFSEMVLNQLFG
ncbi:TetR/AcrR family transcriptional regulator [Pacificimonas sp. WHA3]|uniref:TetR/AcrR family transcriptional regulator n=1 Tax=Pacificimonas pallii TaxID=2827236 RepID=A0ABS6SG28_9SPHN|nr:TetR/AcrR family transcriptional regulator [Pacificimonas pallii]